MFVRRPDARLLTLSFGQGPTTLLAVGGWIGSGEVWHDCFGRLPHWRCVSVDHRGSGASTHQGPITTEAMADDLIAVAETLDLGRCVLAAESAGAGAALRAVQRAPGRFAGLVLVGASWERPAPGELEPFIGALQRDFAATLQQFVEGCVPEPEQDDVKRWGRQILGRATLPHAVELLRCRSTQTAQDHLGEVRLPVLLLHGEHDRIVPPASSRRLAAALPDAELQLLPGLGHVPMMTDPALVARLIERRFVNAELRQAAC